MSALGGLGHEPIASPIKDSLRMARGNRISDPSEEEMNFSEPLLCTLL
jgi:hypothetical protein